MSEEMKVIYRDGDAIRCLRGVVVETDGMFIEVHRRDGIHKINKSIVLRIERGP